MCTLLMLTIKLVRFRLATSIRFYYLVGLVGFFGVFLDMWWARIWPEIRGRKILRIRIVKAISGYKMSIIV